MLGKAAIVVGGSLAGLVAARVLSDFFSTVTILERDQLADEPGHRDGVPQDKHVHAFLKGGEHILTELFPGLDEELEKDGSAILDMGEDVKYYVGGTWRPRRPVGFKVHAQSRPFLEWHLRKRVAALPNVSFKQGYQVTGLAANEDNTRVTGVTFRGREKGAQIETLEADFVVDAGGRGAGTPKWLEQLGYKPPQSDLVKIDLGYTSRFYRPSIDPSRDWKGIVFNTTGPNEPCGGGIFPVENGRWLVTIVGYFGDHAPTDEEGFLDFLRRLPQPDIYEALKDAEPLSPITKYPFIGGVRRFYNELDRFPEGLVTLGDAQASLNPIFGQGMTKCALEAKVLQKCLEERAPRTQDKLDGIYQDYFKRSAKVIDGPWAATNLEDFKYPKTPGVRPKGFKLKIWYQKKFSKLIASDPELFAKVFRVANFLDSPKELTRPSMVIRVLLS